jgi:hypothetical protein
MPKETRVTIRLVIHGTTDRDPWEWAEGIARFLTGELNAERGDFPPATVEVDNAETEGERCNSTQT